LGRREEEEGDEKGKVKLRGFLPFLWGFPNERREGFLARQFGSGSSYGSQLEIGPSDILWGVFLSFQAKEASHRLPSFPFTFLLSLLPSTR